MITKAISELLYHNECVIIPCFGAFIKTNISALIRSEYSEIIPPHSRVIFNKDINKSDGVFYHYVSQKYNCSFQEAKSLVDGWVYENLNKLSRKQAIILEGVGYLKVNTNEDVEFIPNTRINYNLNSFGLSSIKIKEINKPEEIEPENKVVPFTKSSTLNSKVIVESLKWAAVLIPFIGLATWGGINNKNINSYLQNESGFHSWINLTPGKTAKVEKIVENKNTSNFGNIKLQSPANFIKVKEEVDYFYAQAKSENIVETASNTSTATEIKTELQYHIIGGAFAEDFNAKKFCVSSIDAGYNAKVIDKTPNGLYLVSLKQSETITEAQKNLVNIQTAGHPEAWIYKKKQIINN